MNIPVPGLHNAIGLGDAVKAATSAVGVKPCGGCQKRAQKLNQMITFVPPKPTSIPLPMAQVGEYYETALPGLVVGGSIPPGLKFDPAGRKLHGVATRAGKYGIAVSGSAGEHVEFAIEVEG